MKKWILAIVPVVALAAIMYVAFGRSPTAAAEPSPEMLAPVREDGPVTSDAKVVPTRDAALSMPTGGIVSEILISEGEQVKAEQLLLRLTSDRQAASVAEAEGRLARSQASLDQLLAGARSQEVASAQASVEAAEAQLASIEAGARDEEIRAAQAALASAQASLEQVLEGPQEGELVAARADVANAKAALEQAQAAYDQVQWDAKIAMRPESLQLQQAHNDYEAAQGRLSALESGATPATIAGARFEVDRAQAELDALTAPPRAADIAAARAEIRGAQAQLDLIQAGPHPEEITAAQADVAVAEASLASAQAALADTELRAPFSGTIGDLDLDIGEQVAPNTPIVDLGDLSTWQIETDDLTELDVVHIRKGDRAKVRFDALPDVELPGIVSQIKAIGHNLHGDIVYTVSVALEQQDARLRWNMTASVVIEPSS